MKPARAVLAIMIDTSMGKPVFVCRRIPMFSLKAVFFFEETKVINHIHKHGGYSFLLMSDNFPTNQACFKMHQQTLGSKDVHSCNHPVSNDQFSALFLIYHPPHLPKNSLKSIP